MRALARLLAAVCGALVVTGLLVPAAQASGFDSPTIITPANGDQVRIGYTGPATIDFTNSPVGQWTVTLTDPNGDQAFSTVVNTDDSTTTVPVRLSGINQSGQWGMVVDGSAIDCCLDTYTDFEVLPNLSLSNVTLSPTTFYPRVRDGYLDNTTLRYSLTDPTGTSIVTTRVTNSAGTTVRTASWNYGSDRESWTWNGRKNDGVLANTDVYKVTLTARDSAGKTVTAARSVTVASGYRTHTVTKAKTGYSRSSSARTASCYADRDSYDLTTTLDCWGGRYAQANYNFATPANAYNLSWGVSGSSGCCDGGTITRWVTRPSATAYNVHVKVTSWRSYTIDRVRVTYSYKTRV